MLDFSSSGQASREVTRILTDDVEFANASELTSWDAAAMQVRICAECGIERCQPGGWLAPRRMGELAVFIPAFAEILESDSTATEYRPPSFFETDGAPVFEPSTYAVLRQHCQGMPDLHQLPPMTGDEFVRCMQWIAPMRVLGSFPDPVSPRSKLVLASSEGDVTDILAATRDAFQALAALNEVRLTPAPASARRLTLYLDGRNTPEWNPIVVLEDGTVRVSPLPSFLAS